MCNFLTLHFLVPIVNNKPFIRHGGISQGTHRTRTAKIKITIGLDGGLSLPYTLNAQQLSLRIL